MNTETRLIDLTVKDLIEIVKQTISENQKSDDIDRYLTSDKEIADALGVSISTFRRNKSHYLPYMERLSERRYRIRLSDAKKAALNNQFSFNQ